MATVKDNQETAPEGGNENLSFGNVILAVVAAVLGGIVSGLITGALQAPWYVSLGAVGLCLILAWLYAYYWLIIGSASGAKRSGDRRNYTAFRNRLAEGGTIGRAYDKGVAGLLGFSERIYGDAGEDAPTWTSKSFERSLLFATLYPLVAMILIWTVTGAGGLAEAALGLRSDLGWWQRWLIPASTVPLIFWFIWAQSLPEDQSYSSKVMLVFFAVVAMTIPGLIALGRFIEVSIAGLAAGLITIALVVTGTMPVVVTAAIALFGAVNNALDYVRAAASGAALIIVGLLLDFLPVRIRATTTAMVLIVCLIGALPHLYDYRSNRWEDDAALAIFLPLLSLINAPFDWLSLGITRKFMRMGLGKANWKPLLYSFADLIAALFCLIALGAAMVLVIQTFNARLIMEGGAAIYDPAETLRGIANPETRWESQYWWIYATLFSTFIPSFLNLLVGSAAIARGVTPVNRWMLTKLPASGPITRVWLWVMPALLAALRTLTIVLAGAALAGLVYVLSVWILPFFGLNLLDGLTALADANWPKRLLIG